MEGFLDNKSKTYIAGSNGTDWNVSFWISI